MIAEAFSHAQADKLLTIVLRELAGAQIRSPFSEESEPQYTGRCIGPCVERRVTELDIVGLTVAYDGKQAPLPVRFCGLLFRPDVSVSYYGQKVLAIEVKVPSQGNSQDSIAKALGQCLAYASGGYLRSAGFVVTTRSDVLGCAVSEGADGAAIPLLVRVAGAVDLMPSVGNVG